MLALTAITALRPQCVRYVDPRVQGSREAQKTVSMKKQLKGPP